MAWTAAQLRATLRDNPHVRMAQPASGTAPVPRPTRPSPSLSPLPLQALFDTIQDLASAHGWMGQYTYNAEGADAGLHVTLIREVVLCAEVALTPDALSPSQQTWLAALRKTGQVEAYGWTTADVAQITQRLSRRREAPDQSKEHDDVPRTPHHPTVRHRRKRG